jgi:cadmium resistance protein CadD (predicted permease)
VTWLWQACVLFAVTNLDDLVVLSLLFGRSRDVPRSARRIVAGQYLGFGAILAASLAGALGAARLPDHDAAYLGLIPIGMGLVLAYRAWRERGNSERAAQSAQAVSVFGVAGVTLANGGDNIGVFIPAFASFSGAQLIGVAAVFLTLVAVWCAIGHLLSRHRLVAAAIHRWGHVIHPAALITIGLLVLIRGGAFGL